MTDVHADLLDAVGEDTGLTPDEKETSVNFTKRDDAARLFTAEAGLARRVLAHPHADVTALDVLTEAGARRSVPPEEYDGGKIVGVTADVPVGALQVKGTPRKSTQHAEIVTGRVLSGVDE